MKKTILPILALVLIISCNRSKSPNKTFEKETLKQESAKTQKQIKPQFLWSLEGMKNPESIVKYKDFLLVSNINGKPTDKNQKGFISKISLDGKMLEESFVTGLNAPKGMAIYDDKLYVSDINELVEIDLKNSKKTNKYLATKAGFLNDVTADKDGNIYISDTFGGNSIYKFSDGKLSIWLKDEKLDYPNGLLIDGDNIFVASWGKVTDMATFGTDIMGKLIKVSLKDKTITDVSKSIGNLDGLEKLGDDFLITDWRQGELMLVSPKGDKTKLLNLPQGSADIELIDRVVYIPEMVKNKISAYKL